MQTVLFDLDGTLLDTERIYQKYWQIGAREAKDLPDAAGFILGRS